MALLVKHYIFVFFCNSIIFNSILQATFCDTMFDKYIKKILPHKLFIHIHVSIINITIFFLNRL